jgi:hypothetical protein
MDQRPGYARIPFIVQHPVRGSEAPYGTGASNPYHDRIGRKRVPSVSGIAIPETMVLETLIV